MSRLGSLVFRSLPKAASARPVAPGFVGGGIGGLAHRAAGAGSATRARVTRSTSANASAPTGPQDYEWIDAEAQALIAKAYNRHHALANKADHRSPALTLDELRHQLRPLHYQPKNFSDKLGFWSMRFLRRFVHMFFRDNYLHHSVCLETVAAVPGICAAAHRHMRSLRRMERDHGWINPLQEEAENERMHLLIWMKIAKPSTLERALVLFAQASYTSFYTLLYLASPKAAHRLVGYLEEEAFDSYTAFAEGIESGRIPNIPAPDIAREYYRLPESARLLDVVLHVRADEIMHGSFNHMLADKYERNDINSPPAFMSDNFDAPTDLRRLDALPDQRAAV